MLSDQDVMSWHDGSRCRTHVKAPCPEQSCERHPLQRSLNQARLWVRMMPHAHPTPRKMKLMLFTDFSSAFNIIINHSTATHRKAEPAGPLFNWILGFLTRRPQCVRISNISSSINTLNGSTPQGCGMCTQTTDVYATDSQVYCKVQLNHHHAYYFSIQEGGGAAHRLV